MGFKPGEVDQGSKTFDALIGKLHLGRCTVFVMPVEVMQGYALAGQPFFNDKDLGHAPLDGVIQAPFVMAVSPGLPYGRQLRDLLNHELAAMQASGRLDAIMKKHLPAH